MKGSLSRIFRGAGALAMLLAAPAQSQTPPAEQPEDSKLEEEIVVTGTLLRGVAPTGAEVIGLSTEDIAAIGAVSTTQLLASVPQIRGFGTTPAVLGANNYQLAVNRPNLRNLPGVDLNGGNPTLLIMDGHRLPGAGIIQTAPDADILPPSVIERVEVIPDGGSATYGSDAIGGVINYITRKDFDGLELSSRHGAADKYWSTDVNVTYGHNWDTGSAYVAYSFMKHDEIYGGDRDYVKGINWATGVPIDRTCNPGNVTIGATTYALPGLAAGTANACDLSDDQTLYPAEERHSTLLGLTQQIGERVSFEMRAYFTDRSNDSDDGPLTAAVGVGAANQNYRSTGDANATAPQVVSFNFEPVFGDSTDQSTDLETWGIVPTLTVDLTDNWQLRTMLNYGKSETTVENEDVNPGLLVTSVAGGGINPYDVAASTNRQQLADVANYIVYGRGEDEIENGRVVLDGALFTLPGGAMRLAVGAEKLKETFETTTGNAVRSGPAIGSVPTVSGLPGGDGDRDTDSYFAEVFVPIIGDGNQLPGMYSLGLSASIRRDEYSDFGDTSNPRIALDYEPVDWVEFRANWGESFQAPSLADTQASNNSMSTFNFNPVPSPLPGQEPAPGTATLALRGGNINLQPQTASTYSIGTEISPPVVENLRLSLTYYNIDYKGQIGSAPVFDPALFYSSYPDYYVLYPDQPTILAAAAQVQGGLSAVAPYVGPDAIPVYVLIDFRRQNLGRTQLSGLDFTASYDRETRFGTVFGNLSGTYRLSEKDQRAPTLPWEDNTAGDDENPRYGTTATIGTLIGRIRAQATWNHLAGFDVTPTAANNFQGSVDPFDVVNLFAQYDFEGTGLTENLSLTLNVDNVFDQDPSEYQGLYNVSQPGYANGGTLGRLLQLGFVKRF